MMKNVVRLVAGVTIAIGLISLSGCLDSGDPFDPFEQLEEDQLAIDEYISIQGYTDVQTDTTVGDLRYVILRDGSGDFPTGNDWIYLDYKGSLLNGTIFDEKDSVYVRLPDLIPGWQILLPYNREGGRMVMFIPSWYAYRNTGTGTIPPNSPLVFDVEVHDVLTQFDYEQRRINEYAEEYIADYEGEEQLVLETDSIEGLHYIILEEGDGNTYPALTDQLNVDYEGRLINDELFTRATGASLKLEDLIEGWQILLPYVSEGGKIVMFIPSKFGYGELGSRSVSANATLIFTVTLNSISQ